MSRQPAKGSTTEEEKYADWPLRKVSLAIAAVLDIIGIVCGLTSIFTRDPSFTTALVIALISTVVIMIAVVVKDRSVKKNRRTQQSETTQEDTP